AELDIAETSVAAIAVGPGPEDQSLRTAFCTLESGEVGGRRQRVGIVPRRHVHARGLAVAVVEALRPNPELLPEPAVRTMHPLFEQIGLVFRMMTQGRMAGSPGQAGEPVADVFGF